MPQQLLSLSSLPKIQALLVPAAASLWGLGGCGMGDTLGRVGAAGAEVCQEKLEKPWQVPRSPNRPAINRGPRGGVWPRSFCRGGLAAPGSCSPLPPFACQLSPRTPGLPEERVPWVSPPPWGEQLALKRKLEGEQKGCVLGWCFPAVPKPEHKEGGISEWG